MSEWLPILTGVRAYALCPPGACDACDRHWEYYDRYVPEDPDGVFQAGQVGLEAFGGAD